MTAIEETLGFPFSAPFRPPTELTATAISLAAVVQGIRGHHWLFDFASRLKPQVSRLLPSCRLPTKLASMPPRRSKLGVHALAFALLYCSDRPADKSASCSGQCSPREANHAAATVVIHSLAASLSPPVQRVSRPAFPRESKVIGTGHLFLFHLFPKGSFIAPANTLQPCRP
jgi:hypothetical protein